MREELDSDCLDKGMVDLSCIPQKEVDEIVGLFRGSRTMTDRWWMRAPNGKKSNLSEEDWVRVRTPTFKRLYGDWERLADVKRMKSFLFASEPVVSISGTDFGPDGRKLTDKVPEYFEQMFGGCAVNPELGRVCLDIEGVQSDLGHGIGRLKSAAFTAVHDTIEKGLVFNRSYDWKNRGWETAVIGAPILIAGRRFVCEVIVKTLPNSQNFYLHEVEAEEKVEQSLVNPCSSLSRLVISLIACEDSRGRVCVDLDENGEPVVV
ncbi:MAG: hypothetical protein MJZ81_11855 [Bacteroidales bacterium]|nr:hypothetical protein [Bacteroidales bacterium]